MAVTVGETGIAGKIPGERIATTEEPSDSTTTTTSEIEVLSVTAALVSGRTYGIHAWLNVGSTNTGDVIEIGLYRSSLGSNRIQFTRSEAQAAGAGGAAVLYGEFTATTSGDEDFLVGIARGSGSGTINMDASATRPCYLYVNYVQG